MGGLREDFAALVAAGERTNLARAALAIARIAYPDLDPAPYLRQLDGLAAAVRPRLHPGGRPIGERELLARYRTFLGSDAPALPPEALATADTPGILTRMLRNLLHVYLDQKDHAHALAAVELLLVFVPDSADELRVRGLL